MLRINGQVVGIIANQPKVKGGVLFIDSADKAAKFITLCDAFSIPLLFLADVSGFMIGTKVERGGIIRHGAKFTIGYEFGYSTENFGHRSKSVRSGLICDVLVQHLIRMSVIALPTAQIACHGP